MAKPLVSDAFWEFIKPLLPPEPQVGPKGGRPPVKNRPALTGIMFVLKLGAPWQSIPKELGAGSGSTCWRRLAEWTKAGVWQRLHRKALGRLVEQGLLQECLLIIDSASVRALLGGATPGPTRPIGPNRAANAT
jgi:transposase